MKPLHVLLHYIHTPPLRPSSFPLVWQLHLLSTIAPLNMPKSSQPCSCLSFLQTGAVSMIYSFLILSVLATMKNLASSALHPIFLLVPPSPNYISKQASLPSYRPSLSLLLLSFSCKSPLKIISTLSALSSSYLLCTAVALDG